MAVRMSALQADRALPSRKIPGTHFCYRFSEPKGYSAAGKITKIYYYNHYTSPIIHSTVFLGQLRANHRVKRFNLMELEAS
jgi:hypothetical protein